jgi:hypothetical protein
MGEIVVERVEFGRPDVIMPLEVIGRVERQRRWKTCQPSMVDVVPYGVLPLSQNWHTTAIKTPVKER